MHDKQQKEQNFTSAPVKLCGGGLSFTEKQRETYRAA